MSPSHVTFTGAERGVDITQAFRTREFRTGFGLGLLVVAVVVFLALSLILRPATSEILVENHRSAPVIIQLRTPSDRRAWAIAPDTFGPGGFVKSGTPAALYTADCILIQEIVIDGGWRGFVVRADGSVVHIDFGDLSVESTAHPGCE